MHSSSKTRRLFRKAGHPTRPTTMCISPTRPESAKPASSPWDAPSRGQGRCKQLIIVLPSLLVSIIQGWPGWVPHCMRLTRLFRGRGMREHMGLIGPSGSPVGGLFQPLAGFNRGRKDYDGPMRGITTMARSMWSCPGRWMLVAIAALSLAAGTTGEATTSISERAVVEVDHATVDQILDVFHKADATIAAEDLDGVMGLYATQYNYHGLKQADIRKIWFDLFKEYRNVVEVHFFSKIAKVGSGSNAVIEITCTGILSGISKTSGLRVPIDSWHEEVHFLTREGDAWRIRGNAGETPPTLPFGTAPHPLF
jgi:hypothetical protein